MTLYHFGNCVALIYAPYYIIYKYSSLSEYGVYWKCIQAGISYAITQLCKLLLLATFFPEGKIITDNYNLIGEFLKYTVDLIDLIGFYFILSTIPGRGHIKILTASIGWAGAEIIFTKFLLLWIGARGPEFDWKYIQNSLECNINLIGHITTATLIWSLSRYDLKWNYNLGVGLLSINMYKYFIVELIITYFTLNSWLGLIIKASVTSVLSLIALSMYIQVSEGGVH